jgi:hypothetical protein
MMNDGDDNHGDNDGNDGITAITNEQPVLPASHLLISLYQFLTRLDGATIIALSIIFFPDGLCFNNVQRRVIHCRVLPSPISSAIMHPKLSGILLPVTQS